MLAQIEQALPPHGLMLMGGLTEGAETLYLLGCTADFWAIFTTSDEWHDGQPHPVDRWSMRVLGALAQPFGGRAEYPFGGPPYAPVIRYAKDGGQCHQSPVGMLVHGTAGMMISLRGGLWVPGHHPVPPSSATPCQGCAQPCASACPVGALVPGQPYDVAACKAHIASPAGADCQQAGCLVRRACPVSQRFGRLPAQSAHHMAAFLAG